MASEDLPALELGQSICSLKNIQRINNYCNFQEAYRNLLDQPMKAVSCTHFFSWRYSNKPLIVNEACFPVWLRSLHKSSSMPITPLPHHPSSTFSSPSHLKLSEGRNISWSTNDEEHSFIFQLQNKTRHYWWQDPERLPWDPQSATQRSPLPRTAEQMCPHLTGTDPLSRTGLGAAAVNPSRLLQDVGGLLSGLPRYHKVDVPLTGLWEEAQGESHHFAAMTQNKLNRTASSDLIHDNAIAVHSLCPPARTRADQQGACCRRDPRTISAVTRSMIQLRLVRVEKNSATESMCM